MGLGVTLQKEGRGHRKKDSRVYGTSGLGVAVQKEFGVTEQKDRIGVTVQKGG